MAPGLECVLEAVASLKSGASAVVPRPVVAIGRLAADGLVSGLLDDGEGTVFDSWMVVVLVKVDVGAGWVVTVGRAPPGAGCGNGAWGGNKVAEATRAARTAVVSPKATSRSLQGRRGLAKCRGVVSACASSRFDCFFRMKAAPGGGAATGHIGRSFAEWIEWYICVCVDLCPRSDQPAKVSWTKGSCPWIRLGGPSADRRPLAVAIGENVAGLRLQAHGPISPPRLLDVRLARPTEPCRTCVAHTGLSRLHLEWLAWACGPQRVP